MIRIVHNFLASRTNLSYQFSGCNRLQISLIQLFSFHSTFVSFLKTRSLCLFTFLYPTKYSGKIYFHSANCRNRQERETSNQLTKRNMSLENISPTELEVSYYISTGEFTYQESSSSLIEEQRSAFFLNQLRYEEYVNEGLSKKRKYMEGMENKLCFKVMSYNVLSQQLLDQHRYLYRSQPSTVLRWEYRSPRLLAQIVAEDPDILCLQEVQESHIASFYSRLEDIGYKGVFKKRTGGKVDGCAIYYRACIFDLVDWKSVEYFQPRVSVLNRDNVGLIVRLKVGNTHLVVATTHLLYNPRRHDVRLAQIQLFLAEIHRLANFNGKEAGVILTGDLNAKPDSLIEKLISEGTVEHFYPPLPPHLGILPSSTHAASSQLHSSEIEELKNRSSLTGVESPLEVSKYPDYQQSNSPPQSESTTVSHQFNFNSAYAYKQGRDSIATTFQDQWVNVDYIFYSCCEDLELLSRLRLPTREECDKFVRELPNAASPSDHLPLAATFALRIG